MLNLRDIAALEQERKKREAARRMQESQRGESVMWKRLEDGARRRAMMEAQ
jgi:hypothetical protein